MPPVSGPEDKPQGSDVRAQLQKAMSDAGYSARRLAAELQRRRPRADGAESWRNTLGRYLTDNEERRQAPSRATAALLAEILGAAPDAFATPPRGGTELWRENAELRRLLREREAELARYRARSQP